MSNFIGGLLQTGYSHADGGAAERWGVPAGYVGAGFFKYFTRRFQYGGMGANAPLRPGADEHVGLENDFLTGFYKSVYPAEEVETSFHRGINGFIFVIIAGYNDYFRFIRHFNSFIR